MLNKIVSFGLTAFVFLMASSCGPSDKEIRSSVVQLTSERGSCSGTQIEAPSGKKYILTAAHCAVLAKDGIIKVSTEDAGVAYSKIVEEDDKSDLLLLEAAPGIPAVKIASDIHRFSKIISYTHGHGYPTYQTEGSYVGDQVVQFVQDMIDSDAARAKCNKPKNKIEMMDLGFIQIELCTVKTVESATTVPIVPGSSGGLIANGSGELVGVVSAGGDGFGYLVTLKDIHAFLEKR